MDIKRFREFKTDFLDYLSVERNLSVHTLRAYTSDLAQFDEFWTRIAQEELDDSIVIAEAVRRYIVSLFYQKMSKKSLARKLSCLRTFRSFLEENGINVVINVKSPRLDKKLPSILSVEEMSHLLDGVKTNELPSQFPHRDRAVLELLYATGVRSSELAAIKIDAINFVEKTIKVFGKGRRERIVLFGDKARKRLQEYLAKERSQLVGEHKDSNNLFVNYAGTPLTPRSIQRVCSMFRKFLKIDRPLTPHKIRHSFATHMLNQGVSLRVVQELLGHKTISTTEIYTQVSPEELSRICDEKHPLSDAKKA